MRIGSSIGMIAINLQLVGWILAAVGVLGLIASVAIARRAVVPRREVYPPEERF